MRSLALEPPLSHLSVGCSSTIWIQKRMLSVNVPENLRVTPSFIQINVLRVLTHYTGVENSDEGNIWQRLQKYELYTTWDGWVCRKSSISLPVHYQCSYSKFTLCICHCFFLSPEGRLYQLQGCTTRFPRASQTGTGSSPGRQASPALRSTATRPAGRPPPSIPSLVIVGRAGEKERHVPR